MDLLNSLPKAVYSADNSDFEVKFVFNIQRIKKKKQFKVYLDLSKAKDNNESGYFVSAFNNSIKNNKDYLYPDDMIEVKLLKKSKIIHQKLTKIYNINEYGSNFDPEIYDPKSLNDKQIFYDSLGKFIQIINKINVSS